MTQSIRGERRPWDEAAALEAAAPLYERHRAAVESTEGWLHPDAGLFLFAAAKWMAAAFRRRPRREAFVPVHQDRTSDFHPLRGYALVWWGARWWSAPESVLECFEWIRWRPANAM